MLFYFHFSRIRYFCFIEISSLQKKALIKVLQAAKSGNEAEFSRLLQELRKSRKRKTRKSKDSRLGITSTPLHSPDYMMADDDYYCQQQQQQPQQQPPYQWVSCYKFLLIQSYISIEFIRYSRSWCANTSSYKSYSYSLFAGAYKRINKYIVLPYVFTK